VAEFIERYNMKSVDFMVINACQSEKIGESFRDIGVGHVVCIKNKEFQDDKAAIVFSRAFYGELFYSARKVSFCKAFLIA